MTENKKQHESHPAEEKSLKKRGGNPFFFIFSPGSFNYLFMVYSNSVFFVIIFS